MASKEVFEKAAQKLSDKNAARKRHTSVLKLEPQERAFCSNMADGMNKSDAAAAAGYENPGRAALSLVRRPVIQKALNTMIEKTMQRAEITRDDVIDGFKDAIDIARMQSEAMGMISGWREIGKMLGMYETKVKVVIEGGANEIQRHLQGMSDADLLKLMHANSAILPPIEGELADDADDGDDDANDPITQAENA